MFKLLVEMVINLVGGTVALGTGCGTLLLMGLPLVILVILFL